MPSARRLEQWAEGGLQLAATPALERVRPALAVEHRLQPAARRQHAVGQAELAAALRDGVLQGAQALLVAGLCHAGIGQFGLVWKRRRERPPDRVDQLARALRVRVDLALQGVAVGGGGAPT